MSDQAWIAVTASKDISLEVHIDEERITLAGSDRSRMLRRGMSPGSHAIDVYASVPDTLISTARAEQKKLQIELTPASDLIIAVTATLSRPLSGGGRPPLDIIPQTYYSCIEISEPTERSSALWPLVPSNIRGYSKDRYTIIEEPEEFEEPLGADAPRLIDNRASDATVTRRIMVSRDWKRSRIVEFERASKLGAVIRTPIGAQAEVALSEKYGTSTEEAQTYTEEVSITVPPRSSTVLRLAWKQTRKRGILRYLDESEHSLIDIPFSIVTGVTFDQITS